TTTRPERRRAEKAVNESFPASTGAAITDIIIVRSTSYTVDEPEFQALVLGIASQIRDAGVTPVRSYLDTGDPTLVTRDRHATMVQFGEASDDGIDDIVGAVERADALGAFSASATGQKTVRRDF